MPKSIVIAFTPVEVHAAVERRGHKRPGTIGWSGR
jgi:hypothetical protein